MKITVWVVLSPPTSRRLPFRCTDLQCRRRARRIPWLQVLDADVVCTSGSPVWLMAGRMSHFWAVFVCIAMALTRVQTLRAASLL